MDQAMLGGGGGVALPSATSSSMMPLGSTLATLAPLEPPKTSPYPGLLAGSEWGLLDTTTDITRDYGGLFSSSLVEYGLPPLLPRTPTPHDAPLHPLHDLTYVTHHYPTPPEYPAPLTPESDRPSDGSGSPTSSPPMSSHALHTATLQVFTSTPPQYTHQLAPPPPTYLPLHSSAVATYSSSLSPPNTDDLGTLNGPLTDHQVPPSSSTTTTSLGVLLPLAPSNTAPCTDHLTFSGLNPDVLTTLGSFVTDPRTTADLTHHDHTDPGHYTGQHNSYRGGHRTTGHYTGQEDSYTQDNRTTGQLHGRQKVTGQEDKRTAMHRTTDQLHGRKMVTGQEDSYTQDKRTMLKRTRGPQDGPLRETHAGRKWTTAAPAD
ncbi:hypothetical protein Pmani_025264 [Petrolisthes manimaculis]|uniref:Uncharacterized protein n=1 Tax=Petrolisthes manimaculis TaxID=1843537 RepID=A0AAE1P729_9EUCA|nr:hypothetical protein Pmani_025264 [Petrolisthes manimaculis]